MYNKNGNVNLDRIIPGDKGGEYTNNNIAIICSTCNEVKGSKSEIELLKDITRRTILVQLQGISIPENLSRSIKIYEYISKKRFNIEFKYNDKHGINHYFNVNDIYCVKIQDGNTYSTGDQITVTKNDGTVQTHMIKTPIKDDIFLLLDNRYDIFEPCDKCPNNIYKVTTRGYRGKNKSGKKTRPIAICLVCNNRLHLVVKVIE